MILPASSLQLPPTNQYTLLCGDTSSVPDPDPVYTPSDPTLDPVYTPSNPTLDPVTPGGGASAPPSSNSGGGSTNSAGTVPRPPPRRPPPPGFSSTSSSSTSSSSVPIGAIIGGVVGGVVLIVGTLGAGWAGSLLAGSCLPACFASFARTALNQKNTLHLSFP